MSFTIFSQAAPTGASTNGSANTVALEFNVSQACTHDGMWFFSPDASGLPSQIALYKVSGSSLVTSQAPSWSGAAGSGWVFAAFSSPPVLATGTEYRGAVLCNGIDFDATANYWSLGGTGQNGLSNGPLSAPGNAQGNTQGWFNAGSSLTFPGTQFNASNWWIDVQVTPTTQPAAGPVITDQRTNSGGDAYSFVWDKGWLGTRHDGYGARVTGRAGSWVPG